MAEALSFPGRGEKCCGYRNRHFSEGRWGAGSLGREEEGIDLAVGPCSVFIHVAFLILLFFFVFDHRLAIFSILLHSVINYLPSSSCFYGYYG